MSRFFAGASKARHESRKREYYSGLEAAREEGEAKKAVEEKTGMILRVLARLSDVPDSLGKRIRAISDVEELDRLIDVALDCKSLDEFAQHLP